MSKLAHVMNRVAPAAWLATATTGLASAQTPFVLSSVNSGLVLDVKGASKDAEALMGFGRQDETVQKPARRARITGAKKAPEPEGPERAVIGGVAEGFPILPAGPARWA